LQFYRQADGFLSKFDAHWKIFPSILCLFSANRAFVWRRSRREGHGHGATVQKTHRTGAFVTFAEMVWSRNIIYPKEKKKKKQRKMMASDYNWGEIPAFGERTHLKQI